MESGRSGNPANAAASLDKPTVNFTQHSIDPASGGVLHPRYTMRMATALRHSAPGSSSAAGVILAIDYGQKRLGLALSDEHQLTSRPYATWNRTNRRRDLSRLRELVRQERVSRIVVGLPLHLDGTPSEMSEEAQGFARRVEKALGLPVEMADERLTSWEAHETFAATRAPSQASSRPAGRSNTKRQTPLDEIAAAIILRDYLAQARVQRDGARP